VVAQQAQDTFVAVLKDGTERFVAKGDVLPDGHELVKRDQAGAGVLFKKLDLGEDEAPPKSEPAKPEAKAEAAAPVRAAGKAR
jgi:hypothetical protein